MSPRLKAFLKRHGRFPKKGELRRARASSPSRKTRRRRVARMRRPRMAYRYRRGRGRGGHRMAPHRKWLKIAANGIFKVFGIAAMLGPSSGAITNLINTKDISHVGGDVLYGYLGIGSSGIDTGKLTEGVGSVAAGLFLFWLGGQVSKRI